MNLAEVVRKANPRRWNGKQKIAGALAMGVAGYLALKPPSEVPAHRTLTGNEARAYECIKEFAAATGRDVRDAPLYMALIKRESDFRPQAISETGAVGMMQLMEGAVQDVNRMERKNYAPDDRTNMCKNIEMGISYFDHLAERFENDKAALVPRSRDEAEDLAIIAYNMGVTRMRRSMPDGMVLPTTARAFDGMMEATLAADQMVEDRADGSPQAKTVALRTGAVHALPRAARQQAHAYYHAVKDWRAEFVHRIRNYERGVRASGAATEENNKIFIYDNYRPPVDQSLAEIRSNITTNGAYGAWRPGRDHMALDVACETGEPLYPVTKGKITEIKDYTRSQALRGNGLTVRYNTQFGDRVSYLHLSRFAPGIREGTEIDQQTVIGYCGNSGNASTGEPHVHVVIEKGGKGGAKANPIEYFGDR